MPTKQPVEKHIERDMLSTTRYQNRSSTVPTVCRAARADDELQIEGGRVQSNGRLSGFKTRNRALTKTDIVSKT